MSQTIKQWDAANYATVNNPNVRWGARVLERLHPNGVGAIIDAGCGTGRVTELLLARVPGARVIAVDNSLHMLDAAGARLADAVANGRLDLVHADLTECLPVGPVDAVVSTATFHWIADHDAMFTNLAAALRPGGQLVAQCGGAGKGGGVSWAGATHFATPEETADRLWRAGFVEVDTWLEDAPASRSDYVRLNVVARRRAA
jgi:trans-aconitate 2-methyltransferase